MKSAAKKLLQVISPTAFQYAMSVKHRRYFTNRFRAFEVRAKSALYGSQDPFVLEGPFAGMRYLDETVWGSITPPWLGAYECELHDVIFGFADGAYSHIIDVGCAEGYYAVGLLLKFPEARLLAFDLDGISRRQCEKLAALNGVSERISVGCLCDHQTLQERCQPGSLVVCDIEGGEMELLDPDKVSALRNADILVEVHDTDEPAIENALKRRFEPSHEIQAIYASNRMDWIAQHEKYMEVLGQSSALEAVDESRGSPQSWLWMKAIEC